MSARVALADVLAALTWDGDPRLAEFWRASTRPYPDGSRITNRVVIDEKGVGTFNVAEGLTPLRAVAHQPWRHDSPAEALEALHTAALWPFAVEGAGAVRWWCPLCKGSQKALSALSVGPEGVVLASPDPVPCWCVGEAPSFPDLVAVASLGASALLRAASLTEDIARAAGHPKARLVWRVMEAKAVAKHHRNVLANAHPAGSIAFAQVLAATVALFPKDTAAAFAWGDDAGISRALTNPVAALARTEDGGAAGVHLVGLDAGAVTLAVEGVS